MKKNSLKGYFKAEDPNYKQRNNGSEGFDPWESTNDTPNKEEKPVKIQDVIRRIISYTVIGYPLLIFGIVFAVSFFLADSSVYGLKPRSVWWIFGWLYGRPGVYGWWALTIFGLVIYIVLLSHFEMRWMRLKNVKADNSELETYQNESRLQFPNELPINFDIFPDAGAHSKTVGPTVAISHIMLDPKSVKSVKVAQKYTEEDAPTPSDVGQCIQDEDGEYEYKTMPLIDKKFGDELFSSAFLKKDSKFRIFYDARKLKYNPDKERFKTNEKTVAEKIKNDWYFPSYEVQRPGGFYIVDTEPNNTLIIAQTRAGKGQTIIEPTIDMWSRSDNQCNMVLNDPKGELLVKFYYPMVRRGFSVVQFNLMHAERTNIYNPMGYAVDAARRGNVTEMTTLIDQIAVIFFPDVKGEDPVWQNAARAAFKRSAFGLIAYYKEEDTEMREQAMREDWSESTLEHELDVLWGHVTLYNIYKMMTTLASRIEDDPERIHILPSDKAESMDTLTLFFKAMDALPKNDIREQVSSQSGSIEQIANSDKMLASVYGIATVALQFFSDERVARLTSGRPSQNFDITGLGFPRRIDVQIDHDYMVKHSLGGSAFKWTCYRDAEFKYQYEGSDFVHEGIVTTNGWCEGSFKGIFPNRISYMKLELFVADSDSLIKTFYFKFVKHYQHSLDGNEYVEEPAMHEKIINGGSLIEMQKVIYAGKEKYVPRKTVMVKERYDLSSNRLGHKVSEDAPAISQIQVHYAEKQKAVFFITPPNLESYAKIILILINQIFNMQVDKAYSTKADQKPLYPTRYFLDEAGNMKSGEAGIPGIQTKESIGLAQGQYFILVVQTLQQLKDIYGDTIDKIIQGNTNNIIYLKSPESSLLNDLESCSGERHITKADSRTVTYDASRKMLVQNNNQVSTNFRSQKVPTISKTDMRLIPRANDMVFGHGNPIWSRNQLALPYAWRLHKNRLRDATHPEYTLNTVPTVSHTEDFSLLTNTPDFFAMTDKLVEEAKLAREIKQRYMQVNKLHENDLLRIDQNELADELMHGIREELRTRKSNDAKLVEDSYQNSLEAVKKAEGDVKLTKDELGQQLALNDAAGNRTTNNMATYCKESKSQRYNNVYGYDESREAQEKHPQGRVRPKYEKTGRSNEDFIASMASHNNAQIKAEGQKYFDHFTKQAIMEHADGFDSLFEDALGNVSNSGDLRKAFANCDDLDFSTKTGEMRLKRDVKLKYYKSVHDDMTGDVKSDEVTEKLPTGAVLIGGFKSIQVDTSINDTENTAKMYDVRPNMYKYLVSYDHWKDATWGTDLLTALRQASEQRGS